MSPPSRKGQEVVFNLEFEAEPSTGAVRKAARYACGLYCAYDKPVDTALIYLHPASDGRKPRGQFKVPIGLRPAPLQFRVLALWRELDARAQGPQAGATRSAALRRAPEARCAPRLPGDDRERGANERAPAAAEPAGRFGSRELEARIQSSSLEQLEAVGDLLVDVAMSNDELLERIEAELGSTR